MTDPGNRPFPLEDAVAVLARAAATDSSAGGAADSTELHLRAASALDAFAAQGITVPAERFVPLLAGLCDDSSQSILELLITLLRESPAVAQAVADRARGIANEAAPSVGAEAAIGHAARRVLVDPALDLGRYLTRAVVLSNEFRREELARAWAAAIGVPIEAKGRVEPLEKSTRALERLDYRRILADEERLGIERRVLAEHAERVREKQRREAEALASAQRE
jgi:hypothetical protein